MSEKTLNFAERAAALKKKRQEEGSPQQTPPNNAPSEPTGVVRPAFGAKPPDRTQEQEFQTGGPSIPHLDRIPGAPSVMRRFAQIGNTAHEGELGGHIMELLLGGGKEQRKIFDRLKYMEGTLASLRGQMTAAKEAANVALRRHPMRETGTENLIQQFWNSTEHDWSARPSTYIALLDELESRGFFEVPPLLPDPEPQPPAPIGWNPPPEDMPDDDDKPRSPGRPHRSRPKRR